MKSTAYTFMQMFQKLHTQYRFTSCKVKASYETELIQNPGRGLFMTSKKLHTFKKTRYRMLERNFLENPKERTHIIEIFNVIPN